MKKAKEAFSEAERCSMCNEWQKEGYLFGADKSNPHETQVVCELCYDKMKSDALGRGEAQQ